MCVVDVASRYKAAEALRKKDSVTLAEAFEKIYTNTKLKFPKRINIDKGSEFKGAVLTMFKDNNVEVSVSEVSHHKATSIVERFNQTLSQRIFKQVNHKEILSSKMIKDWYDLLQPTIDQLNKEKTRLTGIEPDIAIEMDNVKQHHRIEFDSSKKFEVGDVVRYKIQPDIVHDIGKSKFVNSKVTKLSIKRERRRATDPTYSLTEHKIIKISKKDGLPPLYYLSDIKHGFTSVNLELVS